MRKAFVFFFTGLYLTALLGAVFAVYVLHDVDVNQVRDLSGALAGLCVESFIFALLISGAVVLFVVLGRILLHLKGYTPHPKFTGTLGVGVSIAQYLCDLAARKLFPEHSSFALGLYLIVAVVGSSVALLHDMNAQKAYRNRP
jgi:hypothetical protein